MADPFLSEIRMFSFNHAPKNWALCNGQLLPINQNQALFALMGTTYGGNGQTTFALPNLRGRVPLHMGQTIPLGTVAGEEAHTLTTAELPVHSHVLAASASTANQQLLGNNLYATAPSGAAYHNSSNTAMHPATTTNTGGNQPHENRSPFLAITFCIALTGVFPSH